MTQYRNVYKYHLKKGNKILHTGITNDLDRKEAEHQQKYGKGVHIKQVGFRTTFKEAMKWALKWEEEKRQRSKSMGV